MDMMSLRRRVLVNQNKLVSATGNPLTFNTPLTKPLKECVVRFTPEQEGEGTPSPSNVRPIVGRSSITLYQQGDDGVTHETSVSFDDAPQDVDPSEVAGTIYGGYVDISKGELVAEYTCVTLDGVNVKVNRGGYNSDNFYGAGWVYATPRGKNYSPNEHYLCDKLPLIRLNGGTVPHYSVPASGYLYYMIRVLPKADYPDGLTNAEVITLTNEWLQQNPVTVVYPLTTPIHYPLSPRILTTLKGSNVMWSDANGDITVRYWTR